MRHRVPKIETENKRPRTFRVARGLDRTNYGFTQILVATLLFVGSRSGVVRRTPSVACVQTDTVGRTVTVTVFPVPGGMLFSLQVQTCQRATRGRRDESRFLRQCQNRKYVGRIIVLNVYKIVRPAALLASSSLHTTLRFDIPGVNRHPPLGGGEAGEKDR